MKVTINTIIRFELATTPVEQISPVPITLEILGLRLQEAHPLMGIIIIDLLLVVQGFMSTNYL